LTCIRPAPHRHTPTPRGHAWHLLRPKPPPSPRTTRTRRARWPSRATWSRCTGGPTVDVLPIQLRNLARKLPADERVALLHGDASALVCPDAIYDHVLLFFLLHELPEPVRRATLAEAMRVVRPGGRIVIVDYHRPVALHPLRLLMTGVFRKLEPYAMDLWRHEIAHFMPARRKPAAIRKQTWFGGLYQMLVLTR